MFWCMLLSRQTDSYAKSIKWHGYGHKYHNSACKDPTTQGPGLSGQSMLQAVHSPPIDSLTRML